MITKFKSIITKKLKFILDIGASGYIVGVDTIIAIRDLGTIPGTPNWSSFNGPEATPTKDYNATSKVNVIQIR